METTVTSVIMAIAAPAQTITKNTGVSLVLVFMLIAATITITNLASGMSNDIDNLKEDVSEMREQQSAILKAVQINIKQ